MAISRSVDGTAPAVTASALRVAVLCGLVQMLDGYDLSAVGLAAPAVIKAWGVKPVELTAAFAFSSIGIMVGAMAAGPIADRFGRKPVLLASVALFGIFSLLTVWASSIFALVALRFFTGIGIGGAMPTTVALTSDYTSDRWRTSAVMFMFTGNTIGGFFAGQIAALILPGWGWQGIFMVGGVVPLVLLVLLFFVLPESAQFQPGQPAVKTNPVAGLFRDGSGVEHAALVGDLPDQPPEHVPDRLLAADHADLGRADGTGRGLRRQHLFRRRDREHAGARPDHCALRRRPRSGDQLRHRRDQHRRRRRRALCPTAGHCSCLRWRAAVSSAASSA